MINIRRARKDEVSDLQVLNNELFIDNAQYDSDLDMTWALSERGRIYFTDIVNDGESLCLIAEDGERKVGYLAAGPKEIDFRRGRYFEVQNMEVNSQYRSRGIGKLLMEKCFEWAKEKGFEKAFVISYARNARALEFYKKNGFEPINISLEKRL